MGLIRLTLLLTVAVAILVLEVPSGVSGFNRGRGRGRGFGRGSSSRGSSDESRDNDDDDNGVLPQLIRLIASLTQRVKALEKRGCNSGFLDVVVCDDNNGTSAAVTECTSSQLISGNITMLSIPVNFTADFDDLPTVVAGVTGGSFFVGKDESVEVDDVTLTGFNIKITLEDILPFEVRLFWFACSQAAMIM